jgi:transmembrane sensor
MKMHFNQYVAEDFVMEDSFRNWVLESDSPHRFFWESYLTEHPDQKNDILDAKNLVLALNSLQQETPAQETVDSMWQKIMAEINHQPEVMTYSLCEAH